MNTLMLNMQCLPITTGDEAIECVDAVITATDTIADVVDQLAQLPDEIPGPSSAIMP